MPATVLVVDDESLIRWTLAERLGADGPAVAEADTAKAAIARLVPTSTWCCSTSAAGSDGLTVSGR
jgi:CheY-like chemotaxis protein